MMIYGQSLSLILILSSVYGNFTQWLEAHMFLCPSKKYLHIECPGCGLQRSFIELFRGDITGSFKLYPATVPIMIMLLFLIFHLKNKYPNGARVLKLMYLFCAVVITVNYIYKIATNKIVVH